MREIDQLNVGRMYSHAFSYPQTVLVCNEIIGRIVLGTVNIQNENGEYNIKKNDIFILERGVYKISPCYGEEIKIDTIDINLPYLISAPLKKGAMLKPKRSGSCVSMRTDDVIEAYMTKLKTLDNVSVAHLLRLIQRVVNTDSHLAEKILWYRTIDKRQAVAMDYIYANLAETLSVEKIARKTKLSVHQLNRYFKKTINMPPLKWANYHRISYAKYLVATTLFSIKEISQLAGFNDTSNFIQKYKVLYGKTPFLERKTSRI